MLDRVIEEIQEYASQQVTIRARWRIDDFTKIQPNLAILGDGPHGPYDVVHQLFEMKRRDVHDELASIRTREQEDLFHDSRQPPRRILHDSHRFAVLVD